MLARIAPHDSILLLTNETLACYVGTNSPIRPRFADDDGPITNSLKPAQAAEG